MLNFSFHKLPVTRQFSDHEGKHLIPRIIREDRIWLSTSAVICFGKWVLAADGFNWITYKELFQDIFPSSAAIIVFGQCLSLPITQPWAAHLHLCLCWVVVSLTESKVNQTLRSQSHSKRFAACFSLSRWVSMLLWIKPLESIAAPEIPASKIIILLIQRKY